MKMNKYLISHRIGYFGNSEENLRLQDMVTLIDSPAFIKEVVNIREKRKIVPPVLQSNELLQVANGTIKKMYFVTKKSSNNNIFTSKPTIDRPMSHKEISLLLSNYIPWRRVYKYWSINFTKKSKGLDDEVKQLLVNIKRPYYLLDSALQAILFNSASDVTDNCREVTKDNPLPDHSIVIVVNPRTTVEETKKALRKAKKRFKYFEKEKYTRDLPDTVPNFLHYQAWYWMRLDGKSCSQILKDWVNAHHPDTELPPFTYNDVIKGVKTYKKLLSY